MPIVHCPRCGHDFLPPLPDLNRNVLPVSSRHPDTSRKMRERVLPRTGSNREKVLLYLRSKGEEGATDDEMERALFFAHQSLSSARHTLMKDGWIEDSGALRGTRYGNDAVVWVITEAAERALADRDRPRV